jgi:hypothetical protein
MFIRFIQLLKIKSRPEVGYRYAFKEISMQREPNLGARECRNLPISRSLVSSQSAIAVSVWRGQQIGKESRPPHGTSASFYCRRAVRRPPLWHQRDAGGRTATATFRTYTPCVSLCGKFVRSARSIPPHGRLSSHSCKHESSPLEKHHPPLHSPR